LPPRTLKTTADRGGARELVMGRVNVALGFRLRMLELAVSRSFATHFQDLDITPTLYAILTLIEDNPRCRQSDLSCALGMHQPNLAERVALLIERGLVTARPDSSDRRANVLELTFAGRHFMDKLNQAHEAHLAELRSRLGEEVYDSLMRLLEGIGEPVP
jgi:DNA-binding MarR family transcriptional regulator